jgi:serine/threonin/tyrosin kinase-like protein
LTRKTDTHGEHHVFFDADKQRYFKITHDSRDPDQAGFAIAVDVDIKMSVESQKWIGVPFIRDATPFEYLGRLVLFNRVFADAIQLEGVICDEGHVAIITSQNVIRGAAATNDEVKAAMVESGFVVSDCPPLGRKNVASLSFVNLEEHVAVFDAHAENFLVNEGIVAPIDALITTTDESLEFYLTLTAQERRRELGLQTSAMHGF